MFKKILIFILVFSFLPSFSQASELGERLQGKILLQVEENGEAWYVYPKNKNRYFLGRPADAFQVMRELGLGISNADFEKFKNAMPDRLLGLILLKVEDAGKAFYVNPETKKAHFLGRPADAFQVMREQGLGITSASLGSITEDESSQTRRQTQEKKADEDQKDNDESEETTEPDAIDEENEEEASEEEGQSSESGENQGNEEENASSTEEVISTSTEDVIEDPDLSKNCEFLAEYFRKQEISGAPSGTETIQGIDLNWGDEGPSVLGHINNKFSARFTGDCYFEEGSYKFTAVYDDGIKATLNNWWLVKDWDDNKKVTTATKELNVPEGTHRIKLEYFDFLENAQVSLKWEKVK